jgi:hypothetical protein
MIINRVNRHSGCSKVTCTTYLQIHNRSLSKRVGDSTIKSSISCLGWQSQREARKSRRTFCQSQCLPVSSWQAWQFPFCQNGLDHWQLRKRGNLNLQEMSYRTQVRRSRRLFAAILQQQDQHEQERRRTLLGILLPLQTFRWIHVQKLSPEGPLHSPGHILQVQPPGQL